MKSIAKIGEDGAALLGQCCDRRPDSLIPLTTGCATCALGDPAVDDHEADGLLGEVVRRLHARCGDELEVGRSMLAEPFGEILGFTSQRSSSDDLQHVLAGFLHGTLDCTGVIWFGGE